MRRIVGIVLRCLLVLAAAVSLKAQTTNKALLLNKGGFVQVASNSGLQNPSGITIEGWIYPIENGVINAVFLGKGDGLNGSSDQSYWLSWSKLQGIPGRTLSFQLFLGANTWATIAAPNVASNTWTHFATTYDQASSALKLFTNGVLAATRTVDAGGNPINSQAIRQSTRPLVFGNLNPANDPGTAASGAMDQLRVWSRPLSAEEIRSEYRCGSVMDPSLAGSWTFDGSTPTDDSGKGNHGVLVGGASLGSWVGADLIHAECNTPRAASAKATVVNGFVVGVEILDPGFGYQTPPKVHFLGGGGSNAVGVATVQNGIVTGVKITSVGSEYMSVPRVLIAGPPGVPSLRMMVKQVEIQMQVIPGFTYKLQKTMDLQTWTDVGSSFLATESTVYQDVEVTDEPGIFRVLETP
jgi:hypothetical protein